ncbi:hypothetical protein BOX15_Mlig008018g1 [Macrostomum lignano]|uniref:Calponin-homology (CH) domain-containing protein n=1 Tax=Macrostomum lignano TaxID=282301 RepID=A0A267H5F4_9PLAT|nr:hypothetical protein BOX15_Mlig008018g1 [Macrostomum lignano]
MMACLSRDVLKWLQSLDLSSQIKNPKWDFANGYLVAEILFWYFPREIFMHSYINGNSLESKVKNWTLLKEFFKRHQFCLPEKLIEGTLHCKEDAAILLINLLFEILTRKSGNLDDSDYQRSLALHARSTAAKALKNNLSASELAAQPDLNANRLKAELLLDRHAETRTQERRDQPTRFLRQMSPGERCLRRHPGPAVNSKPAMPSDSVGIENGRSTSDRRRASPPRDENLSASQPKQSRDQVAEPKTVQRTDEPVLEISVRQKSKYTNYFD